MKFRFEDYQGKYVMWCKTEEEAKDFCRVMDEDGRTWIDDVRYISKINYNEYREETCYSFNRGKFGYTSLYKKRDYTILKWEDFMEKKFTKDDLKVGMLVS